MSTTKKNTAILLIHCPDQKGIVAAISDFLLKNHGNVVDIQQHVEKDINHFFMRVEWELADFVIPRAKIEDYFATLIGNKYQMQWQLYFSDKKPRMALFVSKMTHCLYDILQRYMSGEWEVEIPLIIGNHAKLKAIADRFDIDFHHVPMTKATKPEQEAKEIALLKEQEIIGATSHYVTADLDEGPIIVQHTASVSHRDSIKDLIRKGRNLEKMVLSEAIYLQLQHKVLTYQNRTIVF